MKKDFLYGIFGVFAVAADFHAKRQDGPVQQLDGAIHALRVRLLQQRDCLLQLSTHGTGTIPGMINSS
ncbi:MAG: hypothetical protein WA414_08400 [Acidobacteriaceae bacterium]